jgi:hypothetical protein
LGGATWGGPDGAGDSGGPDTSKGGSAGGGGASSEAEAGGSSGASSGSISGSVNGKTFTGVITALYAGMPDDPASTVVSLFEAPVNCEKVSATGWDKRVMNGSQVLELKMMGTTPMVYTVTTSATPAPGEASVNHTVAMPTGTPAETSSSGGKVTLAAITPLVSARGSFDLTFPSGSLNGAFDATYCPGGVEP